MPAKLLIEEDPHRARVALLEEDRLAELFIERREEKAVVGNVYKGRVHRVLPGMQAAFVDIGLERDAFLYARDVRPGLGLDELESFDLGDDETGQEDSESEAEHFELAIDEMLRPGQEIVVQVVKDPLPNKGARVTTLVTLPGRFLVLLPGQSHRGISRRIESEEERERLQAELDRIAEDGREGWIVRTAGEGCSAEDFSSDVAYLRQLWARIRERASRSGAPNLLHRDLDLSRRVIRDLISEDFRVIWVDGEESFTRVTEFLAEVQPELTNRVRLHEQPEPLFERFGIEDAIAEALEPKVWLKSGGHIVINQTEALVAIDVNTGRFVGKTDLEDTIVRTNLEAAKAIARQVRLRNLGGILVVDFIDMEQEENRQRVLEALEQEFARDRARTRVLAISEFGLVQITRKRTRASLERVLTRSCPHCRGRGRIRSLSTLCLDLRREILRWIHDHGTGELMVRVHPEVVAALQGEEHRLLVDIEEALGAPLILEADSQQHEERFDILPV